MSCHCQWEIRSGSFALNLSVWPNSCVLYFQIIKKYENLIKENECMFFFFFQHKASHDTEEYKKQLLRTQHIDRKLTRVQIWQSNDSRKVLVLKRMFSQIYVCFYSLVVLEIENRNRNAFIFPRLGKFTKNILLYRRQTTKEYCCCVIYWILSSNIVACFCNCHVILLQNINLYLSKTIIAAKNDTFQACTDWFPLLSGDISLQSVPSRWLALVTLFPTVSFGLGRHVCCCYHSVYGG